MRRTAIKNYEEQYEVTDTGEVYSLDRVVVGNDGTTYPFKGKAKTKSANVQTGYFVVELYKANKRTKKYVHRLVAEAFIPNPDGKPEVNHIDGNRQNNHVSNLEWVTSSENSFHANNTGLRTYSNRLTGTEFLECLQSVIEGESYQALSERVPYKVPYLSTKLRKIAKDKGIEDLLDESLRAQKAKRARINGARNR